MRTGRASRSCVHVCPFILSLDPSHCSRVTNYALATTTASPLVLQAQLPGVPGQSPVPTWITLWGVAAVAVILRSVY